jgi:hypothetical protein
MNCLDFRRAIGGDPRGLNAEAHAHKATCARCADAHERALGFERTLVAAIAIPVPEGLAERILLRQTTTAMHEPREGRRWLWPVAAGVALTIALAATVGQRLLQPPASLQELAVAHIAHEPLALSSRAVVPMPEVRAMFAALGSTLPGNPGAVHYLNDCPLGGDMSVHMVLQRASGPVTAMFVPGRKEPRREFERAGVRGREAPVADGVLILLAADAQEFDAVESAFQRAFSGADAGAVGAP